MFKGFNIPYPMYTVVLPQTPYEINVRSFAIEDEEFLKGSLLTPNKISGHLNKSIYTCMDEDIKKEEFPTIKDFQKKVSLKDRFALLYGLLHISYKDIRNYDITCKFCGKKYPLTISASDTFNMNKYSGKGNILDKTVKVSLEIFKGVTLYIKQPSLQDEEDSFLTFGYSNDVYKSDIVTEIMIIDKFEQETEEGKKVVYKDREDIYWAYKSLPSLDKRLVHKKYKEEFGQYEVSLKVKSSCTYKECPGHGEEDGVDIDIVDALFRALYE